MVWGFRWGFQRRYDLLCVIDHLGTTSGGHYVALINMAMDPANEDEFDWCCFNDTQRYPLSRQQVEENPNAYVLFYQLRTKSV